MIFTKKIIHLLHVCFISFCFFFFFILKKLQRIIFVFGCQILCLILRTDRAHEIWTKQFFLFLFFFVRIFFNGIFILLEFFTVMTKNYWLGKLAYYVEKKIMNKIEISYNMIIDVFFLLLLLLILMVFIPFSLPIKLLTVTFHFILFHLIILHCCC